MSFTDHICGKKITRAYSICSAPGGNRFELCLNLVKDGLFSPRLFEMKPGDEVEMKGPYGAFILRDPPSDSVFVATGTGIAPIRSLLRAHTGRFPERSFTLLFGCRYEYGLLYRGDFDALARERSNFRFWPTLTRPGPDWKGRQGRVQQHLADTFGDRRDFDVYVCGLKEMVDDVRARLKDAGFERRRIIYEKYD